MKYIEFYSFDVKAIVTKKSREIFFYFTFQWNQFERNLKLKKISIEKSIEFCSFDVKAIVTKKSRVAFCENIYRSKEMW